LQPDDHLSLYYIGSENPKFVLYNAIYDAIPEQCNLFINDKEYLYFDVFGDSFAVINDEKIETVLGDKNTYAKLLNTFKIFFFQNEKFAKQFADFLATQIRLCQGQSFCH
jgi:hypothetical protein